ncbi:sugar ABC transporter ATP-binding protein [Caballeronia sp. RCC_10]|uniref:sugar ABC transporter ATP-binding protein n=1 Tax=Caballeronia sp. RCC_10 TaxID=3239227 RepID=UPI0035247C97
MSASTRASGLIPPSNLESENPLQSRADSPLLVGRGLTKTYGRITVLRDVDLSVKPGELLAVAGENGAGKSTLMKILTGVIPHGEYEGSIELGGEAQQFSSARAGDAAGIVLVPQELHVVPHLSIAENMFAGHMPGRWGLYDEQTAVRWARDALSTFQLKFDPRARCSSLTPSERRLIVLAAALHRSARVLILDEPTAALTDVEAAVLLDQLRSIRDSGVAIIYITHRLDELDQIADRVTVLRNGAVVSNYETVPPRAQLVAAMLGNAIQMVQEKTEHELPPRVGDPVLKVQDISVYANNSRTRPRALNVSFEVYPGEIVGLYGLVGAGRTELCRALYGAWPGPVTGKCSIAGAEGIPGSTHSAVGRGLSLLAEDRKSQGVLHGQSVASNMTASMLDDLSSLHLFINRRKEREQVADLMQQLGVRPARSDIAIDALSGGNQQKVLLGRCLVKGLKILILDEPTLGVDIGARQDIYRLIRRIVEELRIGVLFISSDVEEVLAESDRVLVMYKCRIQGEFSRSATAHDLLSAATGAVNT